MEKMLCRGNELVDLEATETLGTRGISMVLPLQLWGLVFVIHLSSNKHCSCGLICQVSASLEGKPSGRDV